jgi:hypothetical protein
MTCAPETAHAYIDPNTGGYTFRLLFPIISAIIAVFIFFKNQTVNLYRKLVGLIMKRRDDES